MKFKREYRISMGNEVHVETKVIEVDNNEVAELLTMAMEGNLHNVDGKTIRSELERRGSIKKGL